MQMRFISVISIIKYITNLKISNQHTKAFIQPYQLESLLSTSETVK